MSLRKFIIPLALSVASVAGVSISHAASADSSYKSAIEQSRQESEQRLRAPYGTLSIVGLFWLHDGGNRIGSHPASEVPLPSDVAPARLGLVKVAGGTTSLEVNSDTPVSVNGARVKTAVLANDGKSTRAAVEIGRLKLSLVSSEQGQAIQVSDPNSALRRDFGGQQWFSVDEGWRVPARYVAYPQAKIVPYDSAVGGTRSAPSPGYVTFVRDGHEYSLDVLEENAEGRVAIFFDATTGKSTYAGGRVVHIEKGEGDLVTLDFNKAFNRPCAVSPFTVCRIAPEQNRLKALVVQAGEKKPLIKVQRVASAPEYIK